MNYFFRTLFLLLFPIMLQANSYPIIPKPRKLVEATGSFTLTSRTHLEAKGFESAEMQKGITLFSKLLNLSTDLSAHPTNALWQNSTIYWNYNAKIANEGYRLKVTQKRIEIESSSTKGGYYALQTLRQLLPTEFESKNANHDTQWSIPCCTIEDEPQFGYRGMMLDVCRNFATVEEIKSVIDQLSLLKINTFHWHLTDDQGWRIEIKKYPRLTAVGGFRDKTLIGHSNDLPHRYDQKRVGGFYTQKEVRDVVKYAADHFVEIIPEIELPGHAVAALAAYPQFSCSGGPFEVEGRWGIFNDVYCSKEETFHFLEDILSEVVELFPNKQIHIGGDESPRIRWSNCVHCQERIKSEGLKDENALQTYFVQRIEKFLNGKGKEIIGWDEILDKGLAPSTTIMSWRGEKGGIAAAKMGHRVIMTPSSNLYLDYYQSQQISEPLAIGGYVPIEKVYAYHPIPEVLSKEEAKYILGAQANVWTEYMPTREQREHMMFPRIAALAEVGWLPANEKNYNNFSDRLPALLDRYEAMKINYSQAFYDIVANTVVKENKLMLELSSKRKGGLIRFTTDGTLPNLNSPIYTSPILLGKSITIGAMVFNKDKEIGARYVRKYDENRLAGAKVTLSKSPAPQYSGKGGLTLVDCISGRYPIIGSEWLGYEGENVEIEITLPTEQNLSSLTIGFTSQPVQWIYPPRDVTFYVATGDQPYQQVGKMELDAIMANRSKALCTFTPMSVKRIKIAATNYGLIPQGNQGEGHRAWLFIDEIIGK